MGITFLPSTDFEEVARCLDDQRLGAQRYEAWSVLKWLRNRNEYPKLVRAGFCRMWDGYETALVKYINAMLVEWAARGKNNNLLQPYDKNRKLHVETRHALMPPWLGFEKLHSYHRHALVSKFPEHYEKFGWSEDGCAYNGSYLWPDRTDQGIWILRWPKSFKLPPIMITYKNKNNVEDVNGSVSTKEKSKTLTLTRKTFLRSEKNKNESKKKKDELYETKMSIYQKKRLTELRSRNKKNTAQRPLQELRRNEIKNCRYELRSRRKKRKCTIE